MRLEEHPRARRAIRASSTLQLRLHGPSMPYETGGRRPARHGRASRRFPVCFVHMSRDEDAARPAPYRLALMSATGG
jgi:hypothetical protein